MVLQSQVGFLSQCYCLGPYRHVGTVSLWDAAAAFLEVSSLTNTRSTCLRVFPPTLLIPRIRSVLGRIHVNLNKSGVDLASRVTIFNTVVFVLTNQYDISGDTGLYAPHLFLAVKYKKSYVQSDHQNLRVNYDIAGYTSKELLQNKMKSHIALTTIFFYSIQNPDSLETKHCKLL